MSNESHPASATRERLSALADGELESSLVASACAQWRDDASLRQEWHTTHLIGDVLRSSDLASSPARDEDFLQRLRARMADEPVVLAPQALLAPEESATPPALVPQRQVAGGRRWSWMAPSAVAAGFVMVAGALLVTRSPSPAPADTALASTAAAPTSPAVSARSMQTGVVAVQSLGELGQVAATADAGGVGAEPALVLSGQLIRDARLDRYLAAHKQFSGSTVVSMPASDALRSSLVMSPRADQR